MFISIKFRVGLGHMYQEKNSRKHVNTEKKQFSLILNNKTKVRKTKWSFYSLIQVFTGIGDSYEQI